MPLSERALAAEVLLRLKRSFDSYFALAAITKATDGEFYIYGGSVRRVVLHDERNGDLDLIVENGDNRAYETLAALGLECMLNVHRHRYYRWNKLQIDICEPREWFQGFDKVSDMLCTLDLSVNALAVHVKSQTFLDPYKLLDREAIDDPGINWKIWDATNANLELLSIRLARILYEFPHLTISKNDGDKLRSKVIPKLKTLAWDDAVSRFPAGKSQFLNVFLNLIMERTRTNELE
jgi:hypothetical protein